ncbi:MAG: endoglucanase, partial [Actinomycetota bacterium]|nr:endoglucanase [Actinomycetota bacterium]
MRTRHFRTGGRRRAAGLVAAVIAGWAVVPALLPATPAQAAATYNYGEALQKSVYFYDQQRVGKLPASNRVSYRSDALLNDGKDVGVDLSGGFMDAGDEVKFGFPAAFTMTMLSWGVAENREAYAESGQLDHLLSNIRWGTDFIVKQHVAPHVLYGQEGNGGTDHAWWGSVEVNPLERPSYKITESCPGSDLAGESAAALAAASLVFKSTDSAYSSTLITHAKQLYEFADKYRGEYSDCITDAAGYYQSWSGYQDELVWGAIWLYRATGDKAFLDKAESYYANLGTEPQSTTKSYKWTIAWDDKSYGAYVLLAKLTGKQQYADDANRWLDYFTTGVNGSKITTSPGGEVFVDTWGSLRYAANTAWVALDYSDWLKSSGKDTARATTYHDFAVKQVNYALGSNPSNRSYMVGFGTNSPKNTHHRTAHGTWANNIDGPPTASRHLLIGALVGGPSSADDGKTYVDTRNNYQQNEPAIDYNAGLTSALARLYSEFGGTPLASFPPKETPDGPEEYLQAAVNASGPNFTEVKAYVVNQSAWPARSLDDASFRYYFTLDGATKPSDITITTAYNQCAKPGAITQHSGSVYYLTISCQGVHIAPIGQSDYRKEIQFRITAGKDGVGTWDPTNDWSYTGVSTTPGSTPVTVKNVPLYSGTKLLWGNLPGTTPTPSPTVSPTVTPTVSPTVTPTVSPTVTPTVSPTVTPTVSPTVTPTGVPGGCSITYGADQWGSGFTASVTIKNTSGSALSSWSLAWSFPGNQKITNYWNATVTQNGRSVTATNAAHNGAIPAGGTGTFGFQATYTGTNTAPSQFTLNGAIC